MSEPVRMSAGNLVATSAGLVIQLEFDARVHPQTAVLRALYRWSDRVVATVVRDGEWLRCDLEILDPSISAAVVSAGLRREVLDETLRAEIRADTEAIRNVIFALAFGEIASESPHHAPAGPDGR